MPDLGSGVEIHHITTPDLGTGMIDFSRTAEHIAMGNRAASALVATLRDPIPPSPVVRPARFWDRFNRAA